MSENNGRGTPDHGDAAREGDLSERLRRLDTALKSAKVDHGAGEESRTFNRSDSGVAQALRLASEFVAGVLAGGLLGWLFDRLVGSSPWGLIVFLLVGFAAGILNLMRAGGLARKPGQPGDQ